MAESIARYDAPPFEQRRIDTKYDNVNVAVAVQGPSVVQGPWEIPRG